MRSDLISPVTLDDIAEILEDEADEYGWSLVESDDDSDDDDEGLYWQITDGVIAYITIYDNDTDPNVQTILVSAALEDEDATLDDINYCNCYEDLVSAYIDDEDNSIVLRSCLCSADGVTVDSLRSFLELSYQGFIDLIDNNDDDDDDDDEYDDDDDEYDDDDDDELFDDDDE